VTSNTLAKSLESRGSTVKSVSFDTVLKELGRRSFGVLSTITRDRRSHSVGVVYGVSPSGRPLEIYVMTRTKLKKARNILANPNVSFVVPLTRRLWSFLPPPCIQFQGKAEIIDWKDEAGIEAFKKFFVGRRILSMYDELHRRGERAICFLRIMPDPVIFTYMLDRSIWEMRQRMETGTEKVQIPPEFRKPATEHNPPEAGQYSQ